jgi:hypothetical protein
MDLKNLFSQSLGAIGTAVNYKPNQTPLLKDPWGPDIQTMEIRNQQGPSPLAGGYAGFMTPEFDAIKQITDPDLRNFAMMDYITKGREGRDDERSIKLIERLREQQYADRLKSRPLEFQELVAKNLLKTVTDLPGQVMRAGRIYDQEALEAGATLARRPAFQETIRYFS